MRHALILILVSALAFGQSVDQCPSCTVLGGHLVASHAVLGNFGGSALNPGFQFVQEFTPTCSGTSCVAPSDCSSVNCVAPFTIGDIVTIAVGGTDNVTITGVTGSAGTTWANAGCHLNNAGVNQDVEYTTSIAATTQGITANLSGTGNGSFLIVTEWRPPVGYLGIFDGCVTHTATTCTSCVAATPTVTGTDVVEQFVAGITSAPNGPLACPSPYYGTLEGNCISINTTNPSPPTVVMNGSSAVNFVAISFKSTAGLFVPPTQPFNLANYSIPTINAGATCTAGACPAQTIASTTAGDLLYVVEFDVTAGSNTISSISGACSGTWQIPAALHKNGATGNYEINNAYCLSASGGATTITPTMSITMTAFFSIWQFHRITGTWSLDFDNCTLNAGSATFLPSGQPITLSNTNPHVTVQSMVASGGVDGYTYYYSPFALGTPNGQTISNANSTGENAAIINDTVGPTPVAPFPGATSGTQTAACGASWQ